MYDSFQFDTVCIFSDVISMNMILKEKEMMLGGVCKCTIDNYH